MDSSRRSGRSLQYEPLEAREMMAVTGSLKYGILKITGSKYADTVNFAQVNGSIIVAGVGTWSASQINSIVINLKKSADTVSLDSIANGGWEALTEYTTVKTAKNDSDLVHLAGGHDVTLNGSAKTLIVTAGGSATLNGQLLSWNTPTPPNPTPPDPTPPSPSTNWFDSHVLDTALRDLGHNLYTDGLIDRNDMISLLRNAEDGSVVDATELTDLRTITANTSLFGSVDYVWKLANDVVSTNTANAKYQGTALGNLTAGSSAAQMEELVNKWFLGLDRPDGHDVYGQFSSYRQFSGQLFVNGATYSDIHQGNLGDCYFVASLGEVALKDQAAITNMFIINGDGTYTVRFFHNNVADYVTVDSYLPTNSGGSLIFANRGAYYANASNELWTALAEKAYVQANEMGWTRGSMSGTGQNSYAALEGGYIYAALSHITGQSTTPFTYTISSFSFTTFVDAYNSGKMIGFASKSAPASNQVVGGHAYAVVGYNAANQTVTLFNPWGIEYGLVTMTWADIQGSFMYFDRTV